MEGEHDIARRTVLVSANVLFPFTNAGLRDRVTPAIGIDYVF